MSSPNMKLYSEERKYKRDTSENYNYTPSRELRRRASLPDRNYHPPSLPRGQMPPPRGMPRSVSDSPHRRPRRASESAYPPRGMPRSASDGGAVNGRRPTMPPPPPCCRRYGGCCEARGLPPSRQPKGKHHALI